MLVKADNKVNNSRLLTEDEKNILETIMKDKTLAGTGLIRRFIIRNTYTPKYKIGDCVRVTVDRGERIYGMPVKGVKMKIEEINWWLDKDEEQVQYCGTALEKGTNRDFYIVAEESIHGRYTYRHIDGPAEDNINVFEKKSDISQSCDVYI